MLVVAKGFIACLIAKEELAKTRSIPLLPGWPRKIGNLLA